MSFKTLNGVPPWMLAVSAMLAIQLSNALSISVIDYVGPAGTAWLRMTCGAVYLLLIVRPSFRKIRKQDLPGLIGLGVATGFMTTFYLAAIERIPLGTAVAIEFLGPLTVAGLASKNKKALIWPVLAFFGVVLLTEPWQGSVDLIGVGFALLAGICWALYNILTQKVGDRFAGIDGLALTIPIAALATMPVGLPQVLNGNLTLNIFLLAAGIALITPVIAFGLEMLALKRMTHTAFGTLLSIEPAFGVLIGLVVLAQTPAPIHILGVILVVIAGAAAQRGGTRISSASLNEPQLDSQSK